MLVSVGNTFFSDVVSVTCACLRREDLAFCAVFLRHSVYLVEFVLMGPRDEDLLPVCVKYSAHFSLQLLFKNDVSNLLTLPEKVNIFNQIGEILHIFSALTTRFLCFTVIIT